LAQIIAVLHLTEEGLGMPGLWAIVTIADEDVRRLRPTTSIGVMVDDLDWLLFEKLNVRIEIEKQEKIAF